MAYIQQFVIILLYFLRSGVICAVFSQSAQEYCKSYVFHAIDPRNLRSWKISKIPAASS